MADDDLTLRLSLEDDGRGDDVQTPEPGKFGISRFYQRYPERVPASRPDITRALSGQSINIGPPPAPGSYQIYLQRTVAPVAPQAAPFGGPWSHIYDPNMPGMGGISPRSGQVGPPPGYLATPSRVPLGPPAPQYQMMLPLATEIPPRGPAPVQATVVPPKSQFELEYGSGFKNLAEVLEFHKTFGRTPKPGDALRRGQITDVEASFETTPLAPPRSYEPGKPFAKTELGDRGAFNFTHPGYTNPNIPPGFSTAVPFREQVEEPEPPATLSDVFFPSGNRRRGGGGRGGRRGGGGGRGGFGGGGFGGGGFGGRGGGGGGDDGGNGFSINYDPSEDDSNRQTVMQYLTEQMSQPASNYAVSSMAYTVGGAVGRATGSAGLGVMAGGLARGVGTLASAGGLLTTGLALGFQVLAAGVTAVIGAFTALTGAANRLVDDFKEINGPIAATVAKQEVLDLRKDISIANESTALVPFIKAQGEFYREFKDFSAEIVNGLLPIATTFFEAASIPLRMFNKLDKALEKYLNIKGGASSVIGGFFYTMFWPFLWPLTIIAKAAKWWMGEEEEVNFGGAVENFLKPENWSNMPQGQAPWHPFPPAPPGRRRTF